MNGEPPLIRIAYRDEDGEFQNMSPEIIPIGSIPVLFVNSHTTNISGHLNVAGKIMTTEDVCFST
jgi:hypothetical protein